LADQKPAPPSALAHLAIAVDSLDAAKALYLALGFSPHEPETIAREKVRALCVEKDGLRIELLEACPPGEGPIAKFISKRGPGLNHLALQSSNLAADLQALAAAGVKVLPGYPAVGMGGMHVAFLDPKTTGGVLIELVASPIAPSIGTSGPA